MRCALCKEPGKPSWSLSYCFSCKVGTHKDCLQELAQSKCPTIGCKQESAWQKEDLTRLANWQKEDMLRKLMQEYDENHGEPPLGQALERLLRQVGL